MTFGIIGFPLEHSRSPQYFNEKFQEKGINARYLPFEIEDINELPFITEQYPDLKGFNVTIPHKQHIIPFLDRLSPEAQEIGAVNCVKISNSNGNKILTGYNTDYFGARYTLERFIPGGVSHALILGNGGAARAIRYTLKSMGIESLTVSRKPGEGPIGYDEVVHYISGYKLIVNTTPLGMFPHIETFPPIPYERLDTSHYLFDLVYNPECTLFMQKGAAQGAHTTNGCEMLLMQAEKSWEIWQGDEE